MYRASGGGTQNSAQFRSPPRLSTSGLLLCVLRAPRWRSSFSALAGRGKPGIKKGSHRRHSRLRDRLPRGHGRHAAAAPVRRARGLVQGRARHDAGSRRHAHLRHGRRARGGLRRVAFGWRHALHGRRGSRRRALQGHRHRGLPVRLRPHRRRVVDSRDLLQATFLLPYPLIALPPSERALGVV